MSYKKKIVFCTLGILLLLGGGLLWKYQDNLVSWYTILQQSYLNRFEAPSTEQKFQNTQAGFLTGSGAVWHVTKQDRFNLQMEFHTQAPLLNWDEVHEELCEEASILLVLNYYENKSMTNEEFDQALLAMKEEEERTLGVWESTTVAELKRFVESAYPTYRVEIIEPISIEKIEQYLKQGIPVLLPMSGQTIGNPFYKPPGPVYHLLVVKGYTPTHFITNDVGTKRGADYFYDKDLIMQNIHDWNASNIFAGPARGFVIIPK